MRNFAPKNNSNSHQTAFRDLRSRSWEVVIDGVGQNLLHCIFVAPNAGLAKQQAMDRYGRWIRVVSVAEAPEKPPRDAHQLPWDANVWAERRRDRATAAKRRQYNQTA